MPVATSVSPAHATAAASAASSAPPVTASKPAQPTTATALPSAKQLLQHWDESSVLDASSNAAIGQLNLLLTSRAADAEHRHENTVPVKQPLAPKPAAAPSSLLEHLAQREASAALAQFASSQAAAPVQSAVIAPASSLPANFSHASLLALLLSAQLYATTPASLAHLTPADAVSAERALIEAGFPVQASTTGANGPNALLPSGGAASRGLTSHQRHLLYYLHLRSASSSLQSLHQTTAQVSSGAQSLLRLFGAVFAKTTSVREECAALLEEQRALANETLKLQFHLSYFVEMDSIQSKLADARTQPVLAAFMKEHAGEQAEGAGSQALVSRAAATPGGLAVLQQQLSARNPMQSPEFPHVLSALDACLDYMRANADFLDAAPTRARLERLHASVLRAARNYVRDCMETAVRVGTEEAAKAQSQAAAPAAGAAIPKLASPPPSSLTRRMHIQTQLRALSRSLKPLLVEVEHRAFVHEGGIFGAGIVATTSSAAPTVASPGGGATALASTAANGTDGPPSQQPGYYKELLLEWYRLYCSMRHGQLYADLQAQLSQLLANANAAPTSPTASRRPNGGSSLPDIVRAAAGVVMDVCTLEAHLFGEFFSPNGLSSAALNELLAALCNLLYTALRPSVIRETELDALVEVSCVLRGEVRERVMAAAQSTGALRSAGKTALLPASSGSSSSSSSSSSNSSSSSALDLLPPSHPLSSFSQAVSRLTADVQERLSHRAQLYIRDVLQNHQSTPAELDYPNKLLQKEKEKAAAAVAGQTAESASAMSLSPGPAASSSTSSRRGEGALLSQWHPVLERALLLLSKLYRSVDGSVFRYLAAEAISACTATLLQCGASIARVHSAANDAHLSDGLLFSISHLLLLREQLSPFAAVDLEVSGMDLDFSHMREVLPNIFSSVGKWSSFMDLVAESAPRVRERKLDARKHLEAQLKSACEQMIASQTQALLGPLLAFFTRMGSAAQDSTASHGPEHFKAELVGIVAGMTGRPPPTAGAGAGGAPSTLGASLAPAPSPFGTHLSLILRRTHLYLLNPPTERVLFRPVQRSLVEVFEQLAFFVQTHFANDEPAPAAGSSSSAAAHVTDPLTTYLQESIAQLTQIVADNFRD